MDDTWMTIDCEESDAPTPANTPVPSPKLEVAIDTSESIAAQFKEESMDLQQKYFSALFLDVLPLADSRQLAASVVKICKSSIAHPEFVLRLMIAVKDLRVPGLTKRTLVKRIYLEFFEEADWEAKDYDQWMEQLVEQLPDTFRSRRCCCFGGLFL